MPLQFEPTGLETQDLAEIRTELVDAVTDPAVLGPSANTDADSVLGRLLTTLATREASVQALLASLVLMLNPDNAEGVMLEVIARLTGTFREPASFSLSPDGEITGTPATVVPTGAIVRNDRTSEDWVIVNGPYTIPGGGSIACDIEARETGPKEFLGADTWTIVTPVSGWTSFEATADIDPEDIGENVETDASLNARRKQNLLAQGNDFEAIKAGIAQVPGVTYVGGYNNTDPVNTVNGVPPGSFEPVVEGGSDALIAQAIYDRLPPGARSYGTTTVDITTSSGDTVTIGFTRPSDVDLWLRATVVDGAEYPVPINAAALIAAALLENANLLANVGVDIPPRSLEPYVWLAVLDPATGRPTLVSVLVEKSTDGASWSTSTHVISHTQRADFDSARIVVVGV